MANWSFSASFWGWRSYDGWVSPAKTGEFIQVRMRYVRDRGMLQLDPENKTQTMGINPMTIFRDIIHEQRVWATKTGDVITDGDMGLQDSKRGIPKLAIGKCTWGFKLSIFSQTAVGRAFHFDVLGPSLVCIEDVGMHVAPCSDRRCCTKYCMWLRNDIVARMEKIQTVDPKITVACL